MFSHKSLHFPIHGLLLALVIAGPVHAMSLSELRHGSLLLRTTQAGQYTPVPLQETEAQIRITGMVARTVVRQRFVNPTADWVEALYAFPLPEEAAVDHMRMHVGERVIEGEIQAREEARATYVKAREQGQRAALVEQQRPNLFSTAVANIPPHGEIRVEIEYQQTVAWRDDRFSLVFPMAITPRYTPTATGRVEQHMSVNGGWAVLPGELPNAVMLDVPPAEAPILNPVQLSIELQAGFPLDRLESRYHSIDISEQDGMHRVSLQQGPVPAEHDFQLDWSPQPSASPQAAFFTEQTNDGTYAMLQLMPPTAAFDAHARIAREMIFVVDSSGSMGGESMRQAISALSLALDHLAPGDAFNVIDFDSTARALYPTLQELTTATRQEAQRFVQRLNADGGTEMASALRMAFTQPDTGQQRLRQIIFITDGAVGNEEQLLQMVANDLGKARLFTVGIGSAPNRYFMTEAARQGRGTHLHIGSTREVDERMQALFASIDRPALTDLAIDLPVANDILPNPLPDLYRGEPLALIMKLDAPADKAGVQGKVAGIDWNVQLNLTGAQAQSGLGVYWARSKIAYWQHQLLGGEQAEVVRAEVTHLAMTHHLVSPYTSLVAVDKSPARPADSALQGHALPNNKPRGYEQPDSGNTVSMAQGGTWSTLQLILGLPLLLLGLYGRRRWA